MGRIKSKSPLGVVRPLPLRFTTGRRSLAVSTLRKLVDVSSHFLAMDADFDADGKGKTLLKGVAEK